MKPLALILSGLLAGLLLAAGVPRAVAQSSTDQRQVRALERMAEAAERSARAHETMARERCK